jgi:hypothetical protein
MDPRVRQPSLLRDAAPPLTYVAPAPAPTPPRPPLTYKQCRSRLAEVVADFLATEDRLQRLSAAHERAQRDSTEAFLLVEQSEGLLAEAREAAPHDYVTRLLANGDAGSPVDLIDAAEKKLTEANRRRGNAKQGEAIIGEEIAVTERRLASLRYTRRDRIKELVLASPATTKLRVEWEAALAHLGDIFAALYSVDPTAALPGWGNISPTTEGVKVTIPMGDATRWRAALQALEHDASAQLPGE